MKVISEFSHFTLQNWTYTHSQYLSVFGIDIALYLYSRLYMFYLYIYIILWLIKYLDVKLLWSVKCDLCSWALAVGSLGLPILHSFVIWLLVFAVTSSEGWREKQCQEADWLHRISKTIWISYSATLPQWIKMIWGSFVSSIKIRNAREKSAGRFLPFLSFQVNC